VSIPTVHPQIAIVLDAMANANIRSFEDLTPAAARAELLALVRTRKLPLADVAKVDDRVIPGPVGDIPVRVYWPIENKTAGIVVYYHGGGHIIGDLDTHDGLVRSLCARSGTAFVSVDYRLGPEHKFPAAVDDAYAALQWVANNAEQFGRRGAGVAVAGDSAGANLAAVVALMARDASLPKLQLQVLAYPVADYRLVDESYAMFASGYGQLTRKSMEWFRHHYLNSIDEALDWRASPVLADSLANVASALVITSQCDVLHDEGVRLAERLKTAGVPITHRDFAGMIHGFLPLVAAVDAANEAQTLIAQAIIEALA
jgi:acetyl esterase